MTSTTPFSASILSHPKLLVVLWLHTEEDPPRADWSATVARLVALRRRSQVQVAHMRHLVISDVHPEGVARGYVPNVRLAGGRPGRIATYHHAVGEYLRAALHAGLEVRRCEEPRLPHEEETRPVPSASQAVQTWDVWPWCLADLVPQAAAAANEDVPTMLIWHFQLT